MEVCWGLLGKLLLYLVRERHGHHYCPFPYSSFCFEQKHDGWSRGRHMETMKQQAGGKAERTAETHA